MFKIRLKNTQTPTNLHLLHSAVETVKTMQGKSAYQIWQENGNSGTQQDFLASLTGPKGDTGKNSYQLAVEGGYMGTQQEFSEKMASEYIDWFAKGIAIPSGSDLDTYKTNGKYYAQSDTVAKSLKNCPVGTNFVMYVSERTSGTKLQQIIPLNGVIRTRSANSSGWRSWYSHLQIEEVEQQVELAKQELFSQLEQYSVTKKAKEGLTVAIIGDSISTQQNKNAVEMEICTEDIGVQLSCFITTYDKDKTISLDGVTSDYTITDADVGKELTFMPCASDVGKKLGTPKNYNTITGVWWQVAADTLGFEPVVAAWSGSSVTTHTAKESGKECSYAWHDHTIRKLGKRVPGSMNRIAPDVVVIYRGTNDLSHSKNVRLTEGYFDKVDWKYPDTDQLADGKFGYKEGLALTIKKIRTTYPRARIVLCTCNVFKRSNYSHFPTHNGYFSIPQMNNAIREVADFFSCHLMELDKCGITWENLYDEGYVTDSATKPTHPNASGHWLMAQQAINDLINRAHIDDIEPSFDEITFTVGGGDDGLGDDTGTDTEETVNVAKLGTLVEGYYVRANTGAMVASSQYFSYTNIPVKSNAIYTTSYAGNVAFYDAEGNRVGGVAMEGAVNGVITRADGAVTMTVCYKYANVSDPSKAVITETIVEDDETEQLPNLIEQATLVEDNYVNKNTGKLVASTQYFTYTGIPVDSQHSYYAPYARNTAFYDENGIRIGGEAMEGVYNATLSPPAGAVTMAICYKRVDISDPAKVVINQVDRVSADVDEGGDNTEEAVANLASLGTLMDNHYISNDGVLTEYTGSEQKYFAYANIPVSENTTYSAPCARNTAFYTADGSYISCVAAGGSSSAVITTPAGAAFMTITYQHKNFYSTADVTVTKA